MRTRGALLSESCAAGAAPSPLSELHSPRAAQLPARPGSAPAAERCPQLCRDGSGGGRKSSAVPAGTRRARLSLREGKVPARKGSQGRWVSSGEGGAAWGKGEVGGRNAATARDGAPTQRSAGFDTLSPRRGARLPPSGELVTERARRPQTRALGGPAPGKAHRLSREPGQDPSLSASPGQGGDIGNN